jgi:hypothetical protein
MVARRHTKRRNGINHKKKRKITKRNKRKQRGGVDTDHLPTAETLGKIVKDTLKPMRTRALALLKKVNSKASFFVARRAAFDAMQLYFAVQRFTNTVDSGSGYNASEDVIRATSKRNNDVFVGLKAAAIHENVELSNDDTIDQLKTQLLDKVEVLKIGEYLRRILDVNVLDKIKAQKPDVDPSNSWPMQVFQCQLQFYCDLFAPNDVSCNPGYDKHAFSGIVQQSKYDDMQREMWLLLSSPDNANAAVLASNAGNFNALPTTEVRRFYAADCIDPPVADFYPQTLNRIDTELDLLRKSDKLVDEYAATILKCRYLAYIGCYQEKATPLQKQSGTSPDKMTEAWTAKEGNGPLFKTAVNVVQLPDACKADAETAAAKIVALTKDDRLDEQKPASDSPLFATPAQSPPPATMVAEPAPLVSSVPAAPSVVAANKANDVWTQLLSIDGCNQDEEISNEYVLDLLAALGPHPTSVYGTAMETPDDQPLPPGSSNRLKLVFNLSDKQRNSADKKECDALAKAIGPVWANPPAGAPPSSTETQPALSPSPPPSAAASQPEQPAPAANQPGPTQPPDPASNESQCTHLTVWPSSGAELPAIPARFDNLICNPESGVACIDVPSIDHNKTDGSRLPRFYDVLVNFFERIHVSATENNVFAVFGPHVEIKMKASTPPPVLLMAGDSHLYFGEPSKSFCIPENGSWAVDVEKAAKAANRTTDLEAYFNDTYLKTVLPLVQCKRLYKALYERMPVTHGDGGALNARVKKKVGEALDATTWDRFIQRVRDLKTDWAALLHAAPGSSLSASGPFTVNEAQGTTTKPSTLSGTCATDQQAMANATSRVKSKLQSYACKICAGSDKTAKMGAKSVAAEHPFKMTAHPRHQPQYPTTAQYKPMSSELAQHTRQIRKIEEEHKERLATLPRSKIDGEHVLYAKTRTTLKSKHAAKIKDHVAEIKRMEAKLKGATAAERKQLGPQIKQYHTDLRDAKEVKGGGKKTKSRRKAKSRRKTRRHRT